MRRDELPADVSRRVPLWSGMADARLIAAELGAPVVGTEHVLIALMSGPEDDASRALRGAGLDFHAVAQALQVVSGACRRGAARQVPTAEVSDGVDQLLIRASRRRGSDGSGGRDDEVDDHDVLGALLDDDDTTVAALVVTYVGVRRRALDALAAPAEALSVGA